MASENRWRNAGWFNRDRITKLRKLENPPSRGIIKGKFDIDLEFVSWDIPWAFVGDARNSCGPRLSTYWSDFRIIPRDCRYNCWKTVIKPVTVFELWNLFQLMLQMNTVEGFLGKAGVDGRWYTHAPYLGIWYSKSLKEAQKAYDSTLERLHMNAAPFKLMLSNDDFMTIKKGCTEMNHPIVGGFPSSQWEQRAKEENWDEMEDRLNDIVRLHQAMDAQQPTWLQDKIIYTWCEFAHRIGDPTYPDVLGHDPFAYKEDTYHNKGGDNLEAIDQEVQDLQHTLNQQEV
jgi:hypothetical protein